MIKVLLASIVGLPFISTAVESKLVGSVFLSSASFILATACLVSSSVQDPRLLRGLTANEGEVHGDFPANGPRYLVDGLYNTYSLTAYERDKYSSWNLEKTVEPLSLTGSFGQDAGSLTYTLKVEKTDEFQNYKVAGTAILSDFCSFSYSTVEIDLELGGKPVATTTSDLCYLSNSTAECDFNFGTTLPNFQDTPDMLTASFITTSTDGQDYKISVTDMISFFTTNTGTQSVTLTDDALQISDSNVLNSKTLTQTKTVTCSQSPADYTEASNYQYVEDITNIASLTGGTGSDEVDITKSATAKVTCTAIPPAIQLAGPTITSPYPTLTGKFTIKNTSAGSATSVKVGAITVTVSSINKDGVKSVRGTCSSVSSTSQTIAPGATGTFTFTSCKDSNNKSLKIDKYTVFDIAVNGPTTTNQDGVKGPIAGWSLISAKPP